MFPWQRAMATCYIQFEPLQSLYTESIVSMLSFYARSIISDTWQIDDDDHDVRSR